MRSCFSITASTDWLYRHSFSHAGLRSASTDFGDGTTMHCWVPRAQRPEKPALVLVHGFGANATWQWSEHLRPLLARFNVFVPDLLFFGDSATRREERSEAFQARCLMRLMEAMGVRRMSIVGISYGSFVAYSLAAQFPDAVEKLVVCCAGVCLEEKDLEEGLFKVRNLDEAASLLVPQSADKLRQLIKLSFYRPPPMPIPSCFLNDFIHVMCTDYVQEKKELIQAVLKDRKHVDLPKVTQPTLIIWGEQDQIFPLELGHRLKRHLGENARLVVIKHAGHAVNIEKSKEFGKHLKAFLIDSPPISSDMVK